MKSQIKQAIISGFTSKTKDRFNEYHEEKTLEEKFDLISKMEGIDGVEVVYPYEVNNPQELNRNLTRFDLQIAAVNVNIKAEPEFSNGGITSNKKEVRSKAVNLIKDAKDFAKEVNADKVTCCPLGDGYEFSFQYDYAKSWKYIVESFGEAGSYLPEIPLFIEYKPSEVRGRSFVDTAAKTLCLLNDIGLKQMGVTIDFGHSMYGNENPPEVVSMIAESDYPYYIHINDNDAKWDWDYFVGSKHLLVYIEFLYYLQEYGYSGYFTSDTSPTRWDIKDTFETNARLTNKLWNLLSQLDKHHFKKLILTDDYLKTWKFIETEIFSF